MANLVHPGWYVQQLGAVPRLMRTVVERRTPSGKRHTSADNPWDRELERKARERLATLYDQVSDQLEQEFRGLTDLTCAQESTLRTIATWIGLDEVPSETQQPTEVDADEARAVWRAVSRAASVHLLRTAAQLAADRGDPELFTASTLAKLSLFDDTPPQALTIGLDELAEAGWKSLDTDRFIRLTGMDEGHSRLALDFAAHLILAWAGEQTTVLPNDDGYLIVRANGRSLEARYTTLRPGMFVWPEPSDAHASKDLWVRCFAGSVRTKAQRDGVIVTPQIARTAIPDFAFTVDSSSAQPSRHVASFPMKIKNVDDIIPTEAASFAPFGSGWLLLEER